MSDRHDDSFCPRVSTPKTEMIPSTLKVTGHCPKKFTNLES